MKDLFGFIAPIYGLFYNYQKKKYYAIITKSYQLLDFPKNKTIIDFGCGTGALCSVFNQLGFTVTGIDSIQKMLDIAMSKPENENIQFDKVNILGKLPYEDNSFDISIASFVAHGLQTDQRKKMYCEMKRVTKQLLIIYDYNEKRSIITSIVEWLEKGDYFNFIKTAKIELNEVSQDMRVIDVSAKASWYLLHQR